jgi:hypothetical protein
MSRWVVGYVGWFTKTDHAMRNETNGKEKGDSHDVRYLVELTYKALENTVVCWYGSTLFTVIFSMGREVERRFVGPFVSNRKDSLDLSLATDHGRCTTKVAVAGYLVVLHLQYRPRQLAPRATDTSQQSVTLFPIQRNVTAPYWLA